MFFLTKRYTSEVLICTNAVTDYISRRSNGGSVGKKLDGECLGQGPPLSLSLCLCLSPPAKGVAATKALYKRVV